MAVPVIESTTETIEETNVSGRTIYMPETRPNTDKYYLFLSVTGITTVNAPTGTDWALIDSLEHTSQGCKAWLFGLDTSDTIAASYYFDNVTAESSVAHVVRVSGCEYVPNAIDVAESSDSDDATSPAVDVSADDCLVFRWGIRYVNNSNDLITATPSTELAIADTNGTSDDICHGISYETGPSSGNSTGTAAFTDAGGYSQWTAWTIALEPTGSSSTVTATTALGVAIQSTLAAVASMSSAIQAERSTTSGFDIPVAKPTTATAYLAGAIQRAQILSAGMSAALQSTQALNAGFNSALQAAVQAQFALNAAVSAGVAETTAADLAIKASVLADAVLSCAARQTFDQSSDLDFSIQAAKSAATQLTAVAQSLRSVSAGFDLYATLQTVSEAVLTVDLAIQALMAATVDLGLAVSDVKSAASALDVSLSSARTVSVGLDAVLVAMVRMTSLSLSTAIFAEGLAAITALSVMVGESDLGVYVRLPSPTQQTLPAPQLPDLPGASQNMLAAPSRRSLPIPSWQILPGPRRPN